MACKDCRKGFLNWESIKDSRNVIIFRYWARTVENCGDFRFNYDNRTVTPTTCFISSPMTLSIMYDAKLIMVLPDSAVFKLFWICFIQIYR